MSEPDQSIINNLGFKECEYHPEVGEECEGCSKDNVQLYGRSCDPFSQDCEIWCYDCIKEEHDKNEEYDLYNKTGFQY